MSGKKNKRQSGKPRSAGSRGIGAWLRRPAGQVAALALVALLAFLIAFLGGKGAGKTASLPPTVSVEQAYELAQQPDALLLDVREQFEWDEYHAPDALLIPLGELPNRLNEVPKDKRVVVVCRSGNRSDQGRDILLSAGYDATSMDGGLKEWYARGYPTVGAPQP